MSINKGKKYTCNKCNTKFYDMGVKNAKCPNCLLEVIKKNEGKSYSFLKSKKEDNIEIENGIELLEGLDLKKGIFIQQHQI